MDRDSGERSSTRRRRRPEHNYNDSDGDEEIQRLLRNRTNRQIASSSESDSDSSLETVPRRKRGRPFIQDSDTSSTDSDIIISRKRSRGRTLVSESDENSGSDIVQRKRSVTRLPTDDESCSSNWSTSTAKQKGGKVPAVEGSSSDSDGQSEKCPICLLSFKNQEVGSPESCDHSFCVDCIQEWSKNVNTCPVDRQSFNLILVRSHYSGKIVRQISVEVTNQEGFEETVTEDPTFCEICGQCDREDRMLLCDGCDLGYHLECLTPPLHDIPPGVWYCSDCGLEDVIQDRNIYLQEVELLLNDLENMERPPESRSRNHPRLVPRTRQSERVRARVMSNRIQTRGTQDQGNIEQIELVVEQVRPSTSQPTQHRRRRRRQKRRKTKKRSKPNIRITYKIDEETGQEIVIETKSYRRRKRKHKRKVRQVAPPKTVKKRLAVQLGMCAPRQTNQMLPDVRISTSNGNIGHQRFQAGIPTLHLFGNELDLYSGSDADNEGEGSSLLIRRRPNASDLNLMRRSMNRKSLLLPQPATNCDVLGSILDSQEKFHSKNATFSITKDGSIEVNTKMKNEITNNNNNRIDLNDPSLIRVRQSTMYPTNTSSSSPSMNTSHSNSHDYRNAVNTISNSVTNSDSVTTSTGGAGDVESSQNYSQASCSSYEPHEQKKSDDQSESELDIYSDIETVSTSKAEETEIKSNSPLPEIPINMQSDDETNNSDVDLIIDTEKLEEKAPTPKNEKDMKEETVSSTTNVIHEKDEAKDDDDGDDDDADSEDGCPNFSIYSTESINLAKNSDLGILSQTNEVGSSLDIFASKEQAHPIQEEDEEHPPQESDEDDYPGSSLDVSESIQEPEGLVNDEEHQSENSDDDYPGSTYDVGVRERNEKLSGGNDDAYSHSNYYRNERDQNEQSSQDDDEDEHQNQNKRYKEKRSREGKFIKKSGTAQNKSSKVRKTTDHAGLYSDSDDEVMRMDAQKPFGIGDIRSLTEDISEEERSYTPCLDERAPLREGLEGLDTEAISDEEKNDFDESQEIKTASDAGDALEINAKECELEFTKPEDYEEGEIVDKLRKIEEAKKNSEKDKAETAEPPKEPELANKETAFKKISKSNKDRNYRDKEKESRRSSSRDKNKENEKEKKRKKEKRKEIERYNVRTVVAENPRRQKDKFGRDRRRSYSRSSRSRSRSSSFNRRRSLSRSRNRKRRGRSFSRSRSRTPRRSRSHKRRSLSRSRPKRRKSADRSKQRKNRSTSRRKSRSFSPRRRREWERRRSRGWTPSLSRSRTRERRLTPSWTPPRLLENQPVKPQNLTVILTNNGGKKKKEKRKAEKRKRDSAMDKSKRRKRDKTPPPSKEVFASGDNILVSVSFNKENDEREATVRRKSRDEDANKRGRKEKRARSPKPKKRRTRDISGIKPVAIIDLDKSPFKELTPSPKDIIILSDSDNGEMHKTNTCDSNQQPDYAMGPKTPPEPQVKFSLNAKPQQLRAVNNPLHEPDDLDVEIDPQEELEQRLNESLHKGPNTPPDPPNSPPSSPDAYDPFDPTKSRSPTPENITVQSSIAQSTENDRDESSETLDKSLTPHPQTPDASKSHTPPMTEIQPADSQSNTSINTPDTNSKQTPERTIGVVINQVVQPSQTSVFSLNKTPTTTTLVTSTPISTNLTLPRINILNSTIIPATTMSSVPQRIILPTTTKSSPTKVSPSKSTIKLTPLKPMQNKNMNKTVKPSNRKSNESSESIIEFDSPYSPGPSDFEDLFEPPTESIITNNKPSKKINNKSSSSGNKPQSSFDSLFGSSPIFKTKSNKSNSDKKKKNSKTKMVGVKIDEDSLKILDDLPNSAVEMQVKDKFLKKLNRQERVVEEVKLVLKPHYNKKHINKEEYKDILRRAVPKICHNKSGEINPKKIQNLIEAYVKKVRHSKKVTSSSSVNPQK